ncbi:glycosyltransferase [Ruegeria sp. HKCCD7251]|uniref:glycosyltransferase n=2 Tax=unclassified Ruegeria TaxID=2625375 RepID=UPI0035300322
MAPQMKRNFTQKKTSFLEFLALRQSSHVPGRDIREYVLSKKNEPATFGYVANTIETGYAANLRNLFPNIRPFNQHDAGQAAVFLGSGAITQDEKTSNKGLLGLLDILPVDAELLLIEQGFLASTHSWSHAFRENNPRYACLGYVYDDIAHYFMADFPNRLNQKLNSQDTLSEAELSRAKVLIQRIAGQRISKYNAQPMRAPAANPAYKRRVLVCDQAYADASTIYGKVDKADFQNMLVAALNENPDAEVLVKTHPDTAWEKGTRSGYYSHLTSTGRVRLIREPVNPFAIFDQVDKVYVGTSQMGLEALFAGKEVVCFGAPFYAGWGLTDDRKHIPHRSRERSLEELFHYFYLWYTIYNVPGKEAPSEIEDVLDFIEENRPYELPCHSSQADQPPKVSVIIPVHGVEAYIEQCISSVQNQTLREIEIIPVNDCSPDSSQDIIDRLATEDERIRPIVLEKNVGQGFARNKAIEAARGEYIWFLDGDDWLEDPSALAKLYERADSGKFDMVRGRKAYEAIFVGDDLVEKRPDRSERFFTEDVPRTSFVSDPIILNNRHFWVWLYRRDFLLQKEIRFQTPQWEERAFLVNALVNAGDVSLCNVDATAYRVRVGSTARRARNARDFELMFRNFRSTFETLVAAGANDPNSPLREHLAYNAAQFLASMVDGDAYTFAASAGQGERSTFLQRVKELLEFCQLSANEIPSEFVHSNKELSRTSGYPLIAASILADRQDILEYVISRKPIPQDELYKVTLKEAPAGSSEHDLQVLLNTYARNERVTLAEKKSKASFKKPRIVVHIGSTKTGSTFIQHLLEQNRPELMRNGVWYPEIGLFWQKTRPHKQAGHAEVVPYVVADNRYFRQYIERGLQLMEDRVHTIVLSSEAYFLQKNAHRIPDYFDGYEVEMIVYLRDQVEWANAQYCEFVAGGAMGRVDVPISQWLERPEVAGFLDYRNVLNAWAGKIGRDNIKVRLFQSSKILNNDLIFDFAHSTNLELLAELPRPSQSQANSVQLSGPHVELIRSYNSRSFRTRESYLDFIEEITTKLSNWRKSRGLPMPKPWQLSIEDEDHIKALTRDANAEIAKDWLGLTSNSLFEGERKQPESTSLYQEEIAMVAEVYDRYKPIEDVPDKQPQAVRKPPKIIVNYGIFGWRLWLLAPILRKVWKRRLTPETKAQYKRNPAKFARSHWTKKRRDRRIVKMCFPDWDVLGPFGVLRIWRPILRPIIKSKRRAGWVEQFDSDPVKFARSQDKKFRRVIGRLLYPMGELRD